MFALPPAVVAGELVRLQTTQHVVALTFDGGGNADGAKRILKVLRGEHVPATFFLTGHFVRTYPEIARAIGRRYVIGNHTVDHTDLVGKSDASVRYEIAAAATLILRATGRDTHPLFRFPYGARDARTLALCRRLGYVSVRWTVDTWGWMGLQLQCLAGAGRRGLGILVPGVVVVVVICRTGDRRELECVTRTHVVNG